LKILAIIAQFIWLIPVMLFLSRQKHLESPVFRMLFGYALTNVVAGAIALFTLVVWKGMNNLLVYNIQDLVCACVFYTGVRKTVSLSTIHRLVFWAVLIVSVWAIYLSHTFFNAYSGLLLYGFTGFTSLIIMFKLTSPKAEKPMDFGIFWLLCGFIIYSLSELSVYFLLEHIMLNTRWGIIYFRIYNLLVMLVTTGMFTKALLWKTKN
jgi:hypothetical protein